MPSNEGQHEMLSRVDSVRRLEVAVEKGDEKTLSAAIAVKTSHIVQF